MITSTSGNAAAASALVAATSHAMAPKPGMSGSKAKQAVLAAQENTTMPRCQPVRSASAPHAVGATIRTKGGSAMIHAISAAPNAPARGSSMTTEPSRPSRPTMGATRIERAGKRDGTNEAAVGAFRQMKTRAGLGRRRAFGADDEQGGMPERDAQRFGRDAGDVDDHLDCLGGFEDVERRTAFAAHAGGVRRFPIQFNQQLSGVVGHVASVASRPSS